MLGCSDPNFSLGPHHSFAQVGRKGAEFWGSLGYSPLTTPSCRQPGCAAQWACFQTASTVSDLQISVSWALVSAAAPLGGHSEISSAGLLHSEGRHTSTSTSSGTRPLFFPLRTLMKPSCSSSEVTQI